MTPSRVPLTAVAALIGLAVTAVPALAADRCVATTGCAPADTYTASGLQSALTAAGAAGSGRVLIGPGIFVAPAGGFALTAGSVEIVGAGVGTTVIQTGPAQPIYAFALRLYGASAIRDLTLRTIHPQVRPLLLAGTAHGRRIRVEGTPAAFSSWGVFLDGSGAGPVLEDSTIFMNGPGSTAVGIDSAGVLRTSTLTADVGLVASHDQGVAAVSRVRVDAAYSGISSDAGTMTVADSLVTVSRPGATAVAAVNLNDSNQPIAMTFDRVTISGTDAPNQTGVLSQADSATDDNAAVTLRDSIVARVSTSLRRVASPAGTATITTAFTSRTAGVVSQSTGSGKGAITETAAVTAPAVFANPAAGDYRLAPGSPLIDAGDPADAGTADLAGGARPLDGDGDGAARVDLGAFESPVPATAPLPPVAPPTPPPVVAAGDSTPPAVTGLRIRVVGRSARLRARASEACALRIRITRAGVRGSRLRVVAVGRPGPVATAFRLPVAGRYRITVIARDAAGNDSPALRRSLRLAPLRRAAR